MKRKLWLFQIPWIALFTFCFVVTEMGVQGDLDEPFLRESVFQKVRRISNLFTDWKFNLRGPREHRNKIVIVEINEDALDPNIGGVGRWPWHRDVTARLVDEIFKSGAKVVGLDMSFPEPDQRVSRELSDFLTSQNMGTFAQAFETDPAFTKVIKKYRNRVVLGWASRGWCQPLYSSFEDCPVSDSSRIDIPEGFEKFSLPQVTQAPGFDLQKTPMISILSVVGNLPEYQSEARFSGYFDIDPDQDGMVRRTSLVHLGNGRVYSTLALEMARVGLGEAPVVELNKKSKVESIRFPSSNQGLSVNGLGISEINFRGKVGSFPYVSAMEFLREGPEAEKDLIRDEVMNRKIAGLKKSELLKDAYVLIGLTAIGIYDMRAFPFDSNVPGVEGHATILDNVLSNDFISRGLGARSAIAMILFMIFGGLLLAYSIESLSAVPAIGLTGFVFLMISLIDVKVFFENNIHWDTSFLYLEIVTIFITILSAKYVLEEKSKRFVRTAFSKYVSPVVVDSILKDPDKLSVGGEKKELTIMFSDIRGFTSFSETMDAKALSLFLNDYLGIMTQIIFSNQGTLDKYIGDAIMAFWGAPLSQPKHAMNAYQSAIQMMKALEEHHPRFLKDYGVDVKIGIGINSGIVNVGNMGSKDNFSYTVIGDHVNLSSRLEGLTKIYGVPILTTRATVEEIRKVEEVYPPHRVLDFVKVKGKKNSVEILEVLYQTLPEAGLTSFQQARALYLEQNWDQAIQKFEEANQIIRQITGQEDGPSRKFLQRCKEFKVQPPLQDWDGTWESVTK